MENCAVAAADAGNSAAVPAEIAEVAVAIAARLLAVFAVMLTATSTAIPTSAAISASTFLATHSLPASRLDNKRPEHDSPSRLVAFFSSSAFDEGSLQFFVFLS